MKLKILQAETIFVILAGMTALILDSSILTFSKDLRKIWKISLDPYKFPPMKQMYLKYFLSVLHIIRTFTIHITIALYFVMLWPAVFVERRYLLMPWIVVGAVRLGADFLATLVGMYVCNKYGFFNSLWIEFLLVQLLQHGPFFYVWLTILKFRLHLINVEMEERKRVEEQTYELKLGKKNRNKLKDGRQKALEELKDSVSSTTLKTIIKRLSDRKKESMSTRSLDTLLEMMDREDSNVESTSASNEVSSSQPNDLKSSIKEKLQITDEYIEEAKKRSKVGRQESKSDSSG